MFPMNVEFPKLGIEFTIDNVAFSIGSLLLPKSYQKRMVSACQRSLSNHSSGRIKKMGRQGMEKNSERS